MTPQPRRTGLFGYGQDADAAALRGAQSASLVLAVAFTTATVTTAVGLLIAPDEVDALHFLPLLGVLTAAAGGFWLLWCMLHRARSR